MQHHFTILHLSLFYVLLKKQLECIQVHAGEVPKAADMRIDTTSVEIQDLAITVKDAILY